MRRRGRLTDPYSVAHAKYLAECEANIERWERENAERERAFQAACEARWRQRECGVSVRPGYGRAAYAAGCEDEYIDAMKARYGGEW